MVSHHDARGMIRFAWLRKSGLPQETANSPTFTFTLLCLDHIASTSIPNILADNTSDLNTEEILPS